MKRAFVGSFTFLAALLFLIPAPMHSQNSPPGAPVTIVNPLPVPVTISGSNAITGTVTIDGTSLSKNVDEPGRQPYEAYIQFDPTGCGFNCSNFNSLGSVLLFDGPVVPVGKRLIVQHVSGRLPNAGSVSVSVALQQSQIISQQFIKWAFYGPFFTQGDLLGFSAPAFTTYGPGERPHFNLVLPSSTVFIGYVTISGYLIDAT